MSGTFSLPEGISNVLLRSPQIATRAFGVQSPNNIMTSVPKIKFEFYVQFVLGASAQAMLGGNPDLGSYYTSNGLSFKVKTVDKPKINLQTEELNQYNKKVIVYKKIEYGDASIRLHDTVDNSALSTWVNYFTFYFADSRQKNGGSQQSTLTKDPEAPYEQSPYSPTMNWDSGWGFQPLINNDTHFFTGIIVYSLFANTYTAWEYVNPKITNIDWQNYDYSSSETDDLNIQFKYEAIRYLAFAQPISNQQNLAFFNNFGFTNDDYINPACSPTAISSGAIPRIFSSAQAAIQNNTLCNPTGTNNISNPSGNIPTLCQSICSFYSSIYAGAGVAPGALLPVPIPGVSSLINSVSFGGLNGIQNLVTSTAQNAVNSVLVPINQATFGALSSVTNNINGAINSVTGGITNTINGAINSVTGGITNTINGAINSVTGGISNAINCGINNVTNSGAGATISACCTALGAQASNYINAGAAGL